MKKYAMMLLNPQFHPEEHNTLFQTGEIENHILTVRNEEEALYKMEELMKDNFGVLEVCGAFEVNFVQKMRKISKGKLCIGHVIYEQEDESVLEKYWSSADTKEENKK